MNKTILIPGWELGQSSFGATKAYLEFFSQFGSLLVVGPTFDIYDNVDLVVLPGGKDTASDRYGEPPSFLNSDPDKFKEFFLDNNLQGYIDKKIPVFGICLGHQMLNLWADGGLTQNVAHEYSEKSRCEKVHTLSFLPNFKKLVIELGLDKKYEVNSLHHQGFTLEQLGAGFDPIAVGPDNVVEAMVHKEELIASVQYHPEEIYDELSIYLINSLLEQGDKYTKKQKKLEIINEN